MFDTDGIPERFFQKKVDFEKKNWQKTKKHMKNHPACKKSGVIWEYQRCFPYLQAYYHSISLFIFPIIVSSEFIQAMPDFSFPARLFPIQHVIIRQVSTDCSS